MTYLHDPITNTPPSTMQQAPPPTMPQPPAQQEQQPAIQQALPPTMPHIVSVAPPIPVQKPVYVMNLHITAHVTDDGKTMLTQDLTSVSFTCQEKSMVYSNTGTLVDVYNPLHMKTKYVALKSIKLNVFGNHPDIKRNEGLSIDDGFKSLCVNGEPLIQYCDMENDSVHGAEGGKDTKDNAAIGRKVVATEDEAAIRRKVVATEDEAAIRRKVVATENNTTTVADNMVTATEDRVTTSKGRVTVTEDMVTTTESKSTVNVKTGPNSKVTGKVEGVPKGTVTSEGKIGQKCAKNSTITVAAKGRSNDVDNNHENVVGESNPTRRSRIASSASHLFVKTVSKISEKKQNFLHGTTNDSNPSMVDILTGNSVSMTDGDVSMNGTDISMNDDVSLTGGDASMKDDVSVTCGDDSMNTTNVSVTCEDDSMEFDSPAEKAFTKTLNDLTAFIKNGIANKNIIIIPQKGVAADKKVETEDVAKKGDMEDVAKQDVVDVAKQGDAIVDGEVGGIVNKMVEYLMEKLDTPKFKEGLKTTTVLFHLVKTYIVCTSNELNKSVSFLDSSEALNMGFLDSSSTILETVSFSEVPDMADENEPLIVDFFSCMKESIKTFFKNQLEKKRALELDPQTATSPFDVENSSSSESEEEEEEGDKVPNQNTDGEKMDGVACF